MSKTKNSTASMPARGAVAAACLGLLTLAAIPAAAEDQPLSLSLSENYQHDSNVFRAPDNGAVSSDWISNTDVGLKMDKPYGRQEYIINASAGRSQYRENSQINNNHYDANLGFNTDIGSNFRAGLTADSSQTIANFNSVNNSVLVTQKNPLHTKAAGLQLQYGLYGRMTVFGGVNYNSQRYDVASTTFPDRQLTTTNLGLQYSPDGAVRLGAAVRYGTGANGYNGTSTVLDDGVKNKSLDLTALWQLTGLSTVNARFSLVRESHENPLINDFKGANWQLTWLYTPTGKLSFNTFLSRDSGNGSTPGQYQLIGASFTGTGFQPIYGTVGQYIDNTVSNSIGTSATWQLTGKVSLGAQASFTRYSTNYNYFSYGSVNGKSHFTTLGLTANYQPLRRLTISCGAQRSRRSSDGGITSLGFKDTQYNCLGSYTLGGL
jgi:hypothetical protein